MNRFIIVLLCLIIIPLINFGQKFDKNNYKPIQSVGDLPKDFRMTSEQKFIKDKAEIEKNEKHFTRKSKEKFLLQSNFMLDNMLLSGKILYNDPLTKYVNRVADELLKGDENQALREELRIYVTKSPYVNAFSTDQGIILINIGLIAQLENEAQLAYIISHEIIHYIKKHGINLFVETEKISKGRAGYRKLSQNNVYLERNLRSRENESEADELALVKFYSQSDYCLDETDGVFDVLQYSYLPFNEIIFETDYFNTKNFVLPKEYFVDKVSAISGGEDYDEEKSTHPSVEVRRDKIKRLKLEMDNTNKKKFILPKEDFENARVQARFEAIRQLLIERNYPEVIYNSYVLLKKYPNNKFLKTSIAGSLYGLTKYKLNGGYRNVCKSYKKIEGESQQVYHLFKKIGKKELNILALHYCWKLHQEYPENKYLYKISDDLFKTLTHKNRLASKDFLKKSKAEILSESETNDKVKDTEKLSKYDRIKRKKKEIHGDVDYQYAFVDLFKDKEFVELFDSWDKKHLEAKEEIDVNDLPYDERKVYYKEERKKARKIRKYGYALGIDSIVVVDPVYYKIDERKETQIQFIHSERKQSELNQIFKKNAALAKLNLKLIDSKNLNSDDTETFNDLANLSDWVVECFNHEDLSFVMSESQYVDNLIKKYNTKHFAWAALFNVREAKDIDWPVACLMISYGITIPFALYYITKPDYSTHYLYILFDIESGKVKLSVSEEQNQNDNRDFINSKIYDTFFQIKARR